jgi:hypothetical protein
MKLNRKDWDFTAITEKYLGSAIVYEYSRELKDVLAVMHKWISCSTDRILAEMNISGRARAKELLPDFGELLKNTRTGRDILQVCKEEWTCDFAPVFSYLDLLTPLKVPYMTLHFLVVSSRLREGEPWADLDDSEKEEIRSAYEVFFLDEAVRLFPITANVPPNTLGISINRDQSKPAIMRSFARQLTKLDLFRKGIKRPGRSAAPPFEVLKRLAALRLSRTLSYNDALVYLSGLERENLGKRNGRFRQLWPKYDSQGAWQGAVDAASGFVRDIDSGDFTFAKVRLNS